MPIPTQLVAVVPAATAALVAVTSWARAACPDQHLDPGEACDGTDVGGLTCASIPGYRAGTLGCLADCSGFDVSACEAGATWSASSCDRSAVQAAIDVAADGWNHA